MLTATFSHSVTFKTQHASPVTCKIQPTVRSSHPKGVSSLFAKHPLRTPGMGRFCSVLNNICHLNKYFRCSEKVQ